MPVRIVIAAIIVFTLLSLSRDADAKPASKTAPEKPIATENGWDLLKKDCALNKRYQSDKAAGLLIISRTAKEISIMIVQDGFLQRTAGWVEFQFDAAAPIKIETEPPGTVMLIDIEKRMADAFVQRFNVSKELTINYPSWPEEYPTPLSLPTADFKKAWDDCVKGDSAQTESATTSAK
jgi:hypothetical protein